MCEQIGEPTGKPIQTCEEHAKLHSDNNLNSGSIKNLLFVDTASVLIPVSFSKTF